MNKTTTAVGVHLTLAYDHGADQLRRLVDRLSDDAGVEDSPAKMIWLAVAVLIAIAAGGAAWTIFRDAEANLPAPNVPTG